jgi:hypothetical protein
MPLRLARVCPFAPLARAPVAAPMPPSYCLTLRDQSRSLSPFACKTAYPRCRSLHSQEENTTRSMSPPLIKALARMGSTDSVVASVGRDIETKMPRPFPYRRSCAFGSSSIGGLRNLRCQAFGYLPIRESPPRIPASHIFYPTPPKSILCHSMYC